jgi:hypothetical protein
VALSETDGTREIDKIEIYLKKKEDFFTLVKLEGSICYLLVRSFSMYAGYNSGREL